MEYVQHSRDDHFRRVEALDKKFKSIASGIDEVLFPSIFLFYAQMTFYVL